MTTVRGGYRLYSDGWCEQWGRYNDNDAHDYTVTFYKPFTNTLYRPIVGQQLGNGGSTQYRTYNIYTLSTGSMVVHNATNANTNYCIWYCSGFVSLT